MLEKLRFLRYCHFNILRQTQLNPARQRITSSLRSIHSSKQTPSRKMDPLPRRNPGSSSTRSDFGFYTSSNRTFVRGQPLTGTSLPLGRRAYSNITRGGYPGHGGFSVMNAYWLLFSVNAVSFATWWYARLTDNGALGQTHLKHTLTSLAAWDSGRWWTVLTSAFTHHDLTHFAFNMVSLHTFCQIISFVPGIGGGHILMLALGSALAGSGGWVYQQKMRLASTSSSSSSSSSSSWFGSKTFNSASSRIYSASALGASGVVMGVSAVATCLMPKIPIQLMFIPIGIPLWVVTGLYAVADSYFLNSQTSGTAHAGHLGGMFFGVVYYGAMLRNNPIGIWRTVMSKFGGARR